MLNKKLGKIVTTSMVTAAMLANTAMTVLPTLSLTASAGEQLGATNFDNGVGLPWHVCESGPSKLKFDIKGGSYNVTIVEKGGAAAGGESRWDCQFRHRGLKMVAGHTYTVKAEVTSSNTGQIFTKIGNLSGDIDLWHNNGSESKGNHGATWDCMPITANQKLTINDSFTVPAGKGMDVAEWTWQFGGAGMHQPQDCLPNGTVLKFDNMSLVCTTCNDHDYKPKAVAPKGQVRVNQVGYYKNLQKQATYPSTSTSPLTFTIKSAAGATVYTGTSKVFGADKASGDSVHVLDFSDFNVEGTDYTIECDGKPSYKFNIGDWVYDGMLSDAMNYYYQNRSGVDIQSTYITSGDKAGLSHVKGHNPDTAYIQTKWVKSYKADGSDIEKAGTLDCTGGWYDAGDHGKYVVNGGISVWTLNNIYERALKGENNSEISKWADGSGTVVVPEAGNAKPDILDETRVEMEWMLKMIVKDGTNKDLVYHKMHDHKWTGLGCRPADYEAEWGTQRIVKPPSIAATLNMVACAAQSYRLWKDIDATFANKCLDAAKASYTKAVAVYPTAKSDMTSPTSLFAPLDHAIGGGAYGDTEVQDDFYWAACELLAATGDATYKTDVDGYKDAYKLVDNLVGGENSGSFSSFNWGCTAGLGTLSLFLNQDKITAANVTTLKDSIKKVADTYVAQESKEGYGIPYKGTIFTDAINIGKDENGKLIEVEGYEWGSNSFVVNNAIVMAYAYDISKDVKYMNGVSTAMDYIFGRNALDFSYVTGYGDYHCERPHHRFWSNELDPTFPMAPSGVMSGGANSGMQDPYIKGLGYEIGGVAPQLCYTDSIESWSTNEVTINWNAPFAWVVSFLEDEAPLVGSEPQPTTTLYGDCNVDGEVLITDLVLLNSVASMEAGYTLSAQGTLNADCAYDSKVDSSDAIALQKYLVKVFTYDKLGPQ